MASSVSTSQPAPALLASTLLSLESSYNNSTPPYRTGIKSLDSTLPASLWTSHKVIAIITSPSTPSQTSLPAHLIATHLSSSPSNQPVYVITPPNTATASTIHEALSTKLQSPETALQLLDSVSILQYLDLAGLSESIAEVCSDSDSDSSRQDRSVVLIEGLDTTLEGVQRRSGLVQACALAQGLVRSIAHLARNGERGLVLLSLEGLGVAKEGEDSGSAFSAEGRNGTGVVPGGPLGKVILGAVDTAVLAHDALEGGEVVVEVVKDRVCGGLGYWASWKGR